MAPSAATIRRSIASQIIYHDRHIIVMNKPPGLLSQPDKTGDASMYDRTKSIISDLYPKHDFVGAVHRLDAATSGLLMFAKTKKAAQRLSAQFRRDVEIDETNVNRMMTKKYLAIVEGVLQTGGGSMTHLLHTKLNKSYASKVKVSCAHQHEVSPKPGTEKAKGIVQTNKTTNILNLSREGYVGQLAQLNWKVLATKQNVHNNPQHQLSLVEIDLITGRRHQIRAQFSYEGMSVVGDDLYHPKGLDQDNGNGNSYWKSFVSNQSIALHACCLSVAHPLPSRGMLKLHAPLPRLWYEVFGGDEQGLVATADKYIPTILKPTPDPAET